MLVTRAYCPGSVSFIFKVCPNANLTKMGSVGIGCTLDKGVTVEAQKHNTNRIFLNDRLVKIPTVEDVVKILSTSSIRLDIKTSLPLGFGFGISSASSIAAAYAINRLFDLKKNKIELDTIAHICEIKNKTGLGSVGTQVTGGFLFKKKAGLPVVAQSFPFNSKKIYAIFIGKILTPSILKEKQIISQINKAADMAISEILRKKQITMEKIIDISYRFAKRSGLLTDKEVEEVIEKIKREGGCATMTMLGKVIISSIKPGFIQNYSYKTFTITGEAARPLD